MDDTYFQDLGFERWVSSLPFQTTMYVHRCAARDGARLYLAVPSKAPAAATDDRARFTATVEAFFSKHGGRQPEPVAEYLGLLV